MITKGQLKRLVTARRLLDKAEAVEKKASRMRVDTLEQEDSYFDLEDQADKLADRANKAIRRVLLEIISKRL